MNNYELQIQESECGLACIAAILKIKGSKRNLRDLRNAFSISSRGTNLTDLKEICHKVGLSTRALKLNEDDIVKLKLPAILHWSFDHFVVLERVTKKHFYLFDPVVGNRKIDKDEFFSNFTGIALEIKTVKKFKSNKPIESLKLSSLLNINKEIKKTFSFAFIFFLFSEIFVLLTPIYMRFSIDQSVEQNSLQIVFVVSIAFGIFIIINTINDFLKEKAFMKLSLLFSWDMTIRLYMHMIRLPMKWYDNRVLADILTRFDSLEPVKALLTNGAITTILNGFFLIVVTFLLYWLSPNLTIIVIVGVIISIFIKFATLPRKLALSSESLYASIREKTRKIETIKAIQSIKVVSGEIKMESEWINVFSDVISTQEKSTSFNILINVITTAFDSLFLVLIIYFGVSGIISNQLSVGTLFAFMSYRMIFLNRFASILDVIIQIKLLSLHTRRLADIVLEEKEKEVNIAETSLKLKGDLEINNLSFSYSGYDESIIHGLNLKIKKGELVAITGKSGCGKSTLLKILLGLYKPNYGKILYDEIPAASIGFHNIRKHIGSVLQNDELFKGTIADNISFFSETFEEDKLYNCLKIVEFDKEVRKMPMALNTEVGGFFSAGQKQRLLMARALYKNPTLLLFDESTSNLNVSLEDKIIKNLLKLNVSILIITHKPSIMNLATKTFIFENKYLKSVNNRKNIEEPDEKI